MTKTINTEKLRNIPIEVIAERLGLEVRQHKSLCPFHDDQRPSMTYNSRHNRYRCFVCDAHGDTIDLVMKYLHKDFREACAWLDSDSTKDVRYTPVKRVKHRQSTFDPYSWERRLKTPFLTETATHFLYNERSLHPTVIRWLGISSTATHLLFPYRNREGKLLTLQWRYLGNDKSRPRFYFPSGSKCTIYNQPVLKLLREGEELYVSEGVTDCMALLSAGHKAIAIPSATLLNDDDLAVLRDERLGKLNLHIYPDQDAPGERLFLNLRDYFPQIVRHQLPSDCKDFSEYYLKYLIKKRLL